MSDNLAALETAIFLGGLRILTIATFLAFMGWALWHLYKMFGKSSVCRSGSLLTALRRVTTCTWGFRPNTRLP